MTTAPSGFAAWAGGAVTGCDLIIYLTACE